MPVAVSFLALATVMTNSAPLQANFRIGAEPPRFTINRNIYGHFIEHLGSCIYDGIWVGPDSKIPNIRGLRKDAVEALKKLSIPVLRWPGGCFADTYNWRDGIGPRSSRPKRINSFWGHVVETNAFGTHEFMDLCELIGAAPYIAANVGSGTPREMRDWLEYMTSDADTELANLRRKNGRERPWKVPYLGIGNESWGCGGNMTPEYYSDVYKQFSTYAFEYSGNKITKIACGASDSNTAWTDVLMSRAGGHMRGLSLHYYTLPTGDWGRKGFATGFGEREWFETLRRTRMMDLFLAKHGEVMDKYDREKRVGLVVDEWGCWYDENPHFKIGSLGQQNTLRDAIVAALNLNIFNRHADRVQMANVAQMVNVLQSVLLTQGEKTVRTPTYHVFEMYRPHMGATLLPIEGNSQEYKFGGEAIPAVDACASLGADGSLFVSLANADSSKTVTTRINLPGYAGKGIRGRVLSGPALDAANTFEKPENVKPKAFTDLKWDGDVLEIQMPAASVVTVQVT